MRLFVAIAIPEPTRRRIVESVRPFASLATQTTWCRSEQLHITLAFIGDVAPAFLPHLRQTLDEVCAGVTALPCRVAHYGYFGSSRQPKVIWAGVEPAFELTLLHEQLWRALRKLGYQEKGTSFHPHVTLARCKGGAINKALLAEMERNEDDVFGEWLVDKVTLFASKPSPRGSIYRALNTSPLRTAPLGSS